MGVSCGDRSDVEIAMGVLQQQSSHPSPFIPVALLPRHDNRL